MKLESIRLAIRPRSMLECFDLAYLCCGRHAIGLGLAAGFGILPVMLFNWWMFSDDGTGAFFEFLAIALEIPWVTAPITLYLGQVTFSDRFDWGPAVRAWLGGLGQMLIYHGVLRLVGMAMTLTIPFVLVGLYFTNEIILLERMPFSRTWTRHGSIMGRNTGGVVAIRLLDLLIFVVAYPLLTSMFRAISALWQDRYSWAAEDLAEFSPSALLPTESWETQLAFWLVMAFLTVSRFMYYMDCRIRGEGWDVELRLKALAAQHTAET